MRPLFLCTVLVIMSGSVAARGDSINTLNASQLAAQHLDDCLDHNFTPDRDKSDKASSKKRLLDQCTAERDAAAEACHANTGSPLTECRKQADARADALLNLKDASVQ
jgi:hypothetical protein